MRRLTNPNPEIANDMQSLIVDVPDFPIAGITFKDFSKVWSDAELCRKILVAMSESIRLTDTPVDSVMGVESRGFIFGMALAMELGVPFVPARKKGKLPGATVESTYALEYGEATIECQSESIGLRDRVLIHDDVLATGGTAAAAASLVRKLGGEVTGYSFLMELGFLRGEQHLSDQTPDAFIHSLILFDS